MLINYVVFVRSPIIEIRNSSLFTVCRNDEESTTAVSFSSQRRSRAWWSRSSTQRSSPPGTCCLLTAGTNAGAGEAASRREAGLSGPSGPCGDARGLHALWSMDRLLGVSSAYLGPSVWPEEAQDQAVGQNNMHPPVSIGFAISMSFRVALAPPFFGKHHTNQFSSVVQECNDHNGFDEHHY